jgi:hypothetical protein
VLFVPEAIPRGLGRLARLPAAPLLSSVPSPPSPPPPPPAPPPEATASSVPHSLPPFTPPPQACSAKLHASDAQRVATAVAHYEPRIDFDKLLSFGRK